MNSLTKQVLAYAGSQPEGTPLTAKGLLHLSNRAALDQTLSRLARSGEVMRLGRGVYVRPIQTKFGTRSPFAEKVIEQFATARGETIVSSGAAAANALGLTTQVPVRTIYLTSGRSRRLALGNLAVELRHAKPWQLERQCACRSGSESFGMAWSATGRSGTHNPKKSVGACGAQRAPGYAPAVAGVARSKDQRYRCNAWLATISNYRLRKDAKHSPSPVRSQDVQPISSRKTCGWFGRSGSFTRRPMPII